MDSVAFCSWNCPHVWLTPSPGILFLLQVSLCENLPLNRLYPSCTSHRFYKHYGRDERGNGFSSTPLAFFPVNKGNRRTHWFWSHCPPRLVPWESQKSLIGNHPFRTNLSKAKSEPGVKPQCRWWRAGGEEDNSRSQLLESGGDVTWGGKIMKRTGHAHVRDWESMFLEHQLGSRSQARWICVLLWKNLL